MFRIRQNDGPGIKHRARKGDAAGCVAGKCAPLCHFVCDRRVPSH